MSTEVIPYEQKVGALSVGDVRAQVNLIQLVMREVMKKDEHYGVIPGTGTKPSLLKAGAEKLCLTFRLDPQYEVTEKQEGAHLTIMSRCVLYHIPTSQRLGSGMGSCSTKESKYAYRQGKRKCPACGAEQINRSKFPPKRDPHGTPGWYCFAKNGGCGTEFLHDDQTIIGQTAGRIPNEDVADQYNTVLKMANKRSLVAAVLNTTAASDIFTQDIEDMPNGVSDAEVIETTRRQNPAAQALGESPRKERPSPAPSPAAAGPERADERLADGDVIAECKDSKELEAVVKTLMVKAGTDKVRRKWIADMANKQEQTLTAELAGQG